MPFDVAEHGGCILDARADRRAHVKRNLAASTSGKKLEPRNGTSAKDATTAAKKADDEIPAIGERHGQEVAVGRARKSSNRASKPRWKRTRAAITRGPVGGAFAAMRMRLQQIKRHGRHQRARQDVRTRSWRKRPTSPCGTNRKPATPRSANIGTKTMQMQSSGDESRARRSARRRPGSRASRPCRAPDAS